MAPLADKSDELLIFTEADRLTDDVPAVPELTYPAVVTFGVTLTDLVSVSVFVPLVDTVAEDPEMLDGAVTDPVGTALIVMSTSSSPSYPVSGVMVSVCWDVVGV